MKIEFHLLAMAFVFATAGPFAIAEDKQAEPKNESPVGASVQVEQMEPNPIGTDWKWTNMPAFLADGSIYEKAKGEPNRKLKFEVLKDGVVLMTASWTYDGNASGGWLEGRWTDKMVADAGWIPIGEMVRTNKDNKPDPHVVYRKLVKAGEKFELHTRKYHPPLVIVPAPECVPDVLAAKVLRIAPMSAPTARPGRRPEPIVDYQDQAGENGTLVGFRITIDSHDKLRKIGSIQAIYETAQGRTPGPVQGTTMGSAVEVQAKPGYAVGGITLSMGETVAGFNVTFLRRTETGLDRAEKYTSRWIGDQTGTAEVSFETSGPTFAGIRGKRSDAIRSIELIPAKP